MATVEHVALALAPGIGRMRFNELVARFGSPHAVLGASKNRLAAVPGIGPRIIEAIKRADLSSAEQLMRRGEKLGVSALAPGDDLFPDQLRRIPDGPILLFARGKLSLFGRPAVAVVGSRQHSPYGREACEQLTRLLANAGLVVVSGMARGLDAVAHWAALDVHGASIGVLGTGHNVVYPTSNRSLFERMLEHGCLVTERPLGERPSAGSFPERNRIISGLARVTLVVEARKRSGALITAQCALEQGREVMAVPGPITGALSVGTNRLIQMGAKPVIDPRDVLEEFGIDASVPQVTIPRDLTTSERRVLELLADGVSHVDDLSGQFPVAVSDLLPVLTALEIRGLVSQAARMHYRLTTPFDLPNGSM